MKSLKNIKIWKEDEISDYQDGNNKKPSTKDHHIGIEIECFSKVTAFEMYQYLYHTKLDKYVAVKNDGSIEPPRNAEGYEFAICARESEIHKVINRFCSLLKELQFNVNKSCGLHVHLDMRNRDANKCFTKLVRAQNLLYAVNPVSRKKNGYSLPTTHEKLEQYSALESSYRKGINGHALNRHNTIEIRIHAGSVNAAEINNWIKLLLLVINRPELPVDARDKYKYPEFKKVLKINPGLDKYIVERLDKHNKEFKGE
jgi:hypothetical protein